MNQYGHFDDIIKHLEKMQKFREKTLSESRYVISRCSRAIIYTHQNKPDKTQELLDEIKPRLAELQKIATFQTASHIVTAEQEYTEAYTLHHIVHQNKIPSHEDIGVMPESYVLGMLDVIGELKRFMLDCIRTDKPKQADEVFAVMETLYENLYPCVVYDSILKESRRKLDVSRIVLESSRAIITEERRRRDLISVMK